jgi:hypothetical protein
LLQPKQCFNDELCQELAAHDAKGVIRERFDKKPAREREAEYIGGN